MVAKLALALFVAANVHHLAAAAARFYLSRKGTVGTSLTVLQHMGICPEPRSHHVTSRLHGGAA